MQSFPNNFQNMMPGGSNSFVFMQPSYFQPNLHYYPFAPAFQFDFGKMNPSFQNLPSSETPNSFGNVEESILSEAPPTEIVKKSKKEKKVVIKMDKDGEEEQFKVKSINKTPDSSFPYKKKNTQSNIVNQTFTFLSSQKSIPQLRIIFKDDDKKIEEYYRVISKVRQNGKKYINRVFLKRLLVFEKKTEFDRAFVKAKVTVLSVEEIKRTLRILLFSFLREQVNLNLLTSCKIYKETLTEHFWRKRQILRLLLEDLHQEGI